MSELTPTECLGMCFASTFGMSEYEALAKKIVRFLAEGKSKTIAQLGWEEGEGWKKQFTISDVCSEPELFAMFAASGWVQNTFFPKGGFVVSPEFITQVTAPACRSCRGSRKDRLVCTAGRGLDNE